MSSTSRQRARPGGAEAATVQSVDRAIDVLHLLAEAQGLTLSQVAESLGQSAASTYRLLVTLESRRFAEVRPGDQTWHLGPGTFRLGAAFLKRDALVEHARPVLDYLAVETGETALLGVVQDGAVVVLDIRASAHPVRAAYAAGQSLALHASAAGKAILSHWPGPTLERYLLTEPEALTRRTLTGAGSLRHDLKRARDREYAFDNEESAEGLRSLGAAVLAPSGQPVAALAVAAPTARMELHRTDGIGRMVAVAAEELSAAIGGPE